MSITIGDIPLTGNEASQEEIDRRSAERIARGRARLPRQPPAKKPRPPNSTGGGAGGTVASVALLRAEDDHVLLTRATRGGKTLLNLPGGKGEAGETLGQAAAREAHEETGKQLTEGTRDAIAAIAHWAECAANQGRVAVLRLAAGSPDATVHERFGRAAANASRGSKTVHVGLEWHPLSVVSSHAWRAEHMHFPGQHRLAAAVRLLAPSAPSGPSGPSGSSGSGSGSGGPDAPPSALNLGDAAVDE